MNKVVIVTAYDWEGLYVDGKLAIERHSLNERDVLEALDIGYTVVAADEEWLVDRGNLPEYLKDVKREKRRK